MDPSIGWWLTVWLFLRLLFRMLYSSGAGGVPWRTLWIEARKEKKKRGRMLGVSGLPGVRCGGQAGDTGRAGGPGQGDTVAPMAGSCTGREGKSCRT